MRLLLDTHVFIWWDSEPDKLSERALALCQDRENELLLSIVSLWEIQIKMQLGKIELKKRLPELIAVQQELNHLRLLSVNAPTSMNWVGCLLFMEILSTGCLSRRQEPNSSVL